jgi:bifunctional UDP-N-acetylglucosamine pyrophosphorylase/glucosamine-1-phosphate N-acetyltransferase
LVETGHAQGGRRLVISRYAADPAADAHANARGAGAGAAVAADPARPIRPATGGCWSRAASSAIREELDATPAERAITLCNGGLMAFAGPTALAIIERICNDNRKSEYYLTDAIAIARALGLPAVVIETEEDDMRGINTKAQLA